MHLSIFDDYENAIFALEVMFTDLW